MKRVVKGIPKRFSPRYQKVLSVLFKTLKSELPVSFTILKDESKLHQEDISEIVNNLRRWGFIDKEKYIMRKEHYKNIRPYLERDKEGDERFHKSWAGLPLAIILVLITVGVIGYSVYLHPKGEIIGKQQLSEYYGFIKGECIKLNFPEYRNETIYRDQECTLIYEKPIIYQP